jgi:hypothetical protein
MRSTSRRASGAGPVPQRLDSRALRPALSPRCGDTSLTHAPVSVRQQGQVQCEAGITTVPSGAIVSRPPCPDVPPYVWLGRYSALSAVQPGIAMRNPPFVCTGAGQEEYKNQGGPGRRQQNRPVPGVAAGRAGRAGARPRWPESAPAQLASFGPACERAGRPHPHRKLVLAESAGTTSSGELGRRGQVAAEGLAVEVGRGRVPALRLRC